MAIEAVGLMKTYHKRRVVNGVNLLVNPGEVVGLLGPNGAGKTTSFYMIVSRRFCRSAGVRSMNSRTAMILSATESFRKIDDSWGK